MDGRYRTSSIQACGPMRCRHRSVPADHELSSRAGSAPEGCLELGGPGKARGCSDRLGFDPRGACEHQAQPMETSRRRVAAWLCSRGSVRHFSCTTEVCCIDYLLATCPEFRTDEVCGSPSGD